MSSHQRVFIAHLAVVLLISQQGCTVANVRGDKETVAPTETSAGPISLSVDDVRKSRETTTPATASVYEAKPTMTKEQLEQTCIKDLGSFPGKYDAQLLATVCAELHILESCVSRNGDPIYHYNKPSSRPGA